MLIIPLVVIGALVVAFLISYLWGEKIHKGVEDVAETMTEEHTDGKKDIKY